MCLYFVLHRLGHNVPSRYIDFKASRPIQRELVQVHPIAADVVDAQLWEGQIIAAATS